MFLKPNDPLLTKISQEIPQNQLNSPEIKNIADLMLKIIQGEQKGKKKGVGLAAPQIGILKRIILVDVKADGKNPAGDLRAYINPEIVWKSKREGEWYEGCFSTGKVCGIVSRPVSIKIRAFTFTPRRCQAKLVEEKHTGYIARIFQHEIDHLNGKVFVDHINDPEKLHWVLVKEFKKYRKSFKTWPKKCSFEKWQRIKRPLLKTA
ncbi:peptide deformylase [Patescibacteria group bacterium]|nr:peptide deformylase [Patescibacteria group bacterium]